jgi:uncharacterized RDD family membrane protein YckC
MKCPKCGYLGFETTDRCRNCQYDFSLAAVVAETGLPLHGGDRTSEPVHDLDLPASARETDALSATAGLDLDRLFGEPEPAPPPVPIAEETLPTISMSFPSGAEPEPQPKPTAAASGDEGALPFDDGPIVPPPAARPPLAVRRSTVEAPRNRPRTTRPVRMLDLEPAAKSAAASQAATDTVASLMEMPSLGARLGAGLIDLLLLGGIDAAVVYLTLRVTGLQNTLDDLRVLSPVPFVGFLATLAFGYVAAFTVAGGQTIGKMALSLRVIGDDGRPVDAGGAMLRALGCMLVPITLGLSYLPVLFMSDHRAIHDRLAGTRVVQE